MGRIGIRGANAVLFVLSCFLVARVANQIIAGAVAPESPGIRYERPTQEAPSDTVMPSNVILERNLFGARIAPEASTPEPEENLEETRLPLALLGTIASKDQLVASAAIEDQATKTHEIVRVGDHLKSHAEVEVKRIERRRVILQNGDRREELRLNEDESPRLAKAVKPKPRGRRQPRHRNARAKRDGLKNRLQELAGKSGGRSPAAIFSQARILPKYEQGRMVGIELSKIKPDSFYEKVGLHDGDVITQLNGVDIDNPSASRKLLEAFTSATDIDVTVVRGDGRPEQIVVSPDTLAQLGLE